MNRLIPLALVLSFASPALAKPLPSPRLQAEISLSFAPVVKAAAPAVVNIYATRTVQDRVSPFADDPFFGQFFRDLAPRTPRVQNSLGSGVIVTAEGIVVSNYHVIEGADAIRVVLNDRREFAASVMLADEESDLAVLQLDGATGLPALPLRDSDEVEVGDLVLAIGDPFGVGQTVSSGIVSGLARSGLSVGDGRGYFIQTDASINPGNSGGALVDMTGRLVGINTAIISRTGGSVGIGFAIPANLVRSVLGQAQAGAAEFQRPWAGTGGQAVDAALAEAMGLAAPAGVVLNDIHPESPFLAAGLRPGDVILSLAGNPTNTPEEVSFRMAAAGIGATVPVTYLRDADRHETDVVLQAAPDSPDRDTRTIAADVALRGLTIARINPAVTEELNLPLHAEGVAVVAAEDLAARAGFRPGDVLLSINGTPVATPADVTDAAAEPTRYWDIAVLRQGEALRIRFRV